MKKIADKLFDNSNLIILSVFFVFYLADRGVTAATYIQTVLIVLILCFAIYAGYHLIKAFYIKFFKNKNFDREQLGQEFEEE